MAKRTSTVVEITLTTKSSQPGAEEILKDVLVNCGLKRDELIETHQNGATSVIGYVASASKARRIKEILSRRKIRYVKISSKLLRNQDWQNAWKDDFHSFALTRKLDVVPTWEKNRYKVKRKIPVYIDTVLAFGTGLHETTRFMAMFIEARRSAIDAFLDVGTGTGILAIIARKHGARVVHAIDINKGSVDVAKKNFQVNGCRADLLRASDAAKFQTKQKYSFVAANLTSDVLIRLRRKLVSFLQPGGYLAISGVSLKHYREVRDKFKPLPLRCVKVEKGKLWAAVLFQKRKLKQ